MPSPQDSEFEDDMDTLKKLGRKILQRVSSALDQKPGALAPVMQHQNDYIFGSKSSLLSVTQAIADLMLKLHNAAEARRAGGATAAASEPEGLSEGDITLAEAFVQRVRQSH